MVLFDSCIRTCLGTTQRIRTQSPPSTQVVSKCRLSYIRCRSFEFYQQYMHNLTSSHEWFRILPRIHPEFRILQWRIRSCSVCEIKRANICNRSNFNQHSWKKLLFWATSPWLSSLRPFLCTVKFSFRRLYI